MCAAGRNRVVESTAVFKQLFQSSHCPMFVARARALAARLQTPRTMATGAAKGPGTFTYEWQRPGLTVDVTVVQPPSTSTSTTHLLLIQRGQAPAVGRWALPGGFVEPEEDLDVAAARELEEETGLAVGGSGTAQAGAAATTTTATDTQAAAGAPATTTATTLRQVAAFGGPDRDPRGWTVTVAYAAILPPADAPPAVAGGDDAAAAKWWPVQALPDLAFDHSKIIAAACRSVAQREGAGTAWGGELVAGAAALEARPWEPTRE